MYGKEQEEKVFVQLIFVRRAKRLSAIQCNELARKLFLRASRSSDIMLSAS